MNTRFAVLAATVLLSQAAVAETPSTAQASITNLTFVLTDLDLNDGITPAVKFVPDGDFEPKIAVVSAHNGPYVEDERELTLPTNNFVEVSLSGPSSDMLYARSAMSGEALGLSVSTEARAFDLVGDTRSFAAAYGPSGEIWVTGNTRITLSVDISVASAAAPADNTAWAWSSAWMRFGDTTFSLEHIAGNNPYIPAAGEATTRNFSADYSSGSWGNWIDFQLYASSGASTATPVPEPETWGMLLAGLGTVGALARRRQRSPA